MKTFGEGLWSTLAFLLVLSCWHVDGQPIIYQATGTREQLQPVIDQFKRDIIYGVGGSEQNPPSILGRFNVATLDDVSDKFIGSYRSPLTSGGLTLLGGPWVGLYVGGDQYPSFSPPNGMTLATLASSEADLVWVFTTDADVRFNQNAFGAVFANVGPTSPASLEGIFVDLSSFAFPVQPTAGTNDFSFIGIIDPQQPFNTSAFRMHGTYYRMGETPSPPSLRLRSRGRYHSGNGAPTAGAIFARAAHLWVNWYCWHGRQEGHRYESDRGQTACVTSDLSVWMQRFQRSCSLINADPG